MSRCVENPDNYCEPDEFVPVTDYNTFKAISALGTSAKKEPAVIAFLIIEPLTKSRRAPSAHILVGATPQLPICTLDLFRAFLNHINCVFAGHLEFLDTQPIIAGAQLSLFYYIWFSENHLKTKRIDRNFFVFYNKYVLIKVTGFALCSGRAAVEKIQIMTIIIAQSMSAGLLATNEKPSAALFGQ